MCCSRHDGLTLVDRCHTNCWGGLNRGHRYHLLRLLYHHWLLDHLGWSLLDLLYYRGCSRLRDHWLLDCLGWSLLDLLYSGRSRRSGHFHDDRLLLFDFGGNFLEPGLLRLFLSLFGGILGCLFGGLLGGLFGGLLGDLVGGRLGNLLGGLFGGFLRDILV